MSSNRHSRRRESSTNASGHNANVSAWARGPPRQFSEDSAPRVGPYETPPYTEAPFPERAQGYASVRMEYGGSGRPGAAETIPLEVPTSRPYTSPPRPDRDHRRDVSPADASLSDWPRTPAHSQYAPTPNTEPQRTYNGVDSQSLFRRLSYQPHPEESGREIVEVHTVGHLYMEHDPLTDVRLRFVSLGFAISVRPDNVLNGRASYSSQSSTSIVDMRFVRLAGLLPHMIPLRMADKVEIQEAGTSKPYRVYGRVSVPFNAGKWSFDVLCWVVDIFAPVEILLGNDWMARYRAKVSVSLDGMKIEDARAPFAPGDGVSDHYEESFA